MFPPDIAPTGTGHGRGGSRATCAAILRCRCSTCWLDCGGGAGNGGAKQ